MSSTDRVKELSSCPLSICMSKRLKLLRDRLPNGVLRC